MIGTSMVLAPIIKGFSAAVLGIGTVYGGGVILYKKFTAPSPLAELLENVTEKKFSKGSVVSRKIKGNGVVQYCFKIPAGLSVMDMIQIKPAIEDKFDCEVDVWAEGGKFIFELCMNPIPKTLRFNPALVAETLKEYECGMYLGKSRHGDVVFDFTNPLTPHLLFGGPTGKGKSNLLNQGICSMIGTYSPEHVQFILIDLKDGVELDVYRNLPHVRAFYETVEEVFSGLESIIQEIHERNQFFKALEVKQLKEYNRLSENPLPRIVIIADEFAQFSNIAENDFRKAVYKRWETILQKGRSAGIHCVLGTQVTDADVFPKQIKGNIDARFGFKFTDPQHSKMITGGSELTRLPSVIGRGLFKLGDKLIQTQVPKIEVEQIRAMVDKYKTVKKVPASLPMVEKVAGIQLDNVEELFITEESLKSLS